MLRLGALAACAVAYLVVPVPMVRAGDHQCGPAAKIIAGLKSQYDEVPTYTGSVGAEGGAMTFTVSPRGTWTMVVAAPPDQLCIIAAGEQWQAVAPSADAPHAAPGNLPDAPALLEHGLILIRQ